MMISRRPSLSRSPVASDAPSRSPAAPVNRQHRTRVGERRPRCKTGGEKVNRPGVAVRVGGADDQIVGTARAFQSQDMPCRCRVAKEVPDLRARDFYIGSRQAVCRPSLVRHQR